MFCQVFSVVFSLKQFYNIFIIKGCIIIGIPEKWNPGPSSWDPSPGTRDSRPIGGTRDLRPLRGTRDLGSST